jgi:hypothetical protein
MRSTKIVASKAEKPANGLEKNTLSAESIVDLIKISAASGLTSLKFGDLQLEFGPKKIPDASTASRTEIPDEKAIAQLSKEALEDQELALRQEQIDNMLVEDPLRAEELIAQGELVPDDDGRVEPDDADAES